jgi:hypothetical protein
MSDGFGGNLPIRLFLSSQNLDLIVPYVHRHPSRTGPPYFSIFLNFSIIPSGAE